jgi:hypothetical protein
MKDYYKKSMKALQFAGMSECTQQCYNRSVRMPAESVSILKGYLHLFHFPSFNIRNAP